VATKAKKELVRPEAVRPVVEVDPVLTLTEETLVQSIFQAIIAHGEPAKLVDIQKSVADDSITLGLIRKVLTSHPRRFVQRDRRWDVSTRYLDGQRPALKILEEILTTYGAPMAAWDAAHELGLVFHRSTEGQQKIAERLLFSSDIFFPVPTGTETKFGLTSWLLDIQDRYKSTGDLLFYNYLSVDALKPYSSLKLDWEADPVGAALQVIDATPGSPKVVDNRLLLLMAYLDLAEDFDAEAIYVALTRTEQLVALPGHRWTNTAGIQALRALFTKQSLSIADSPEEEEPETEPSIPLAVSLADLVEIERIFNDTPDKAIRISDLLDQIYEVTPGDPTYDVDSATLTAALVAVPDKFTWVGYDQFRLCGTLPPIIGQVPESLQFPVVPQVETPEGDVLDQILDEEGFERGLEKEILSPYAQDVNDQEESAVTIWPNDESAESKSIRLVLKAHHKEIFTFPLVQIPPGFITQEPAVVEITLQDSSGKSYQAFADNSTQLLYGFGLFDLYADIVADSGAVIKLEKTATPGEFLFLNQNENDPDIYVSPERLQVLQEYREEIEAGPSVATYDLVRYILEHSNSAMSFLSILTELNIVRRVKRRQLASILSAWSGFSVRAGLWSYDSKKAAQGFNKSKRKYVH
jgi:hypothetical protein